MTKEQLLIKYGVTKPQTFGSDGFIYLLDVMGDDHSIAESARISYGAGTKNISKDTELIRYLIKNYHTSPLEQCEIRLHMQLPIYIFRQIVRHRTASLNEYSARYSIAIDKAETAFEWRSQSVDNKQGSGGPIIDWPTDLSESKKVLLSLNSSGVLDTVADWEDAISSGVSIRDYLSGREAEIQALCRQVYNERLALGVAREQARKDLPLSTYTQVYYKQDLHNLLHFLFLREDKHAQQEVRDIANAISNIVADWCPIAYEAFNDFKREAITLSTSDQAAFHRFLTPLAAYELDNKLDSWNKNPETRKQTLIESGLTGQSERIDFIRKLKLLMGTQ